MKRCFSPITPLVALVAVEAAIVVAVAGWFALAWAGIASTGPVAGVVLAALVVCAVITLMLPVLHFTLQSLRPANCPDEV